MKLVILLFFIFNIIGCSSTLPPDYIITDIKGIEHRYQIEINDSGDYWCLYHQKYEMIKVYTKVENN